MNAIRAIQITDLHLLSEPGAELYGVDTAIALQKVIAAIGELSPPANLMIATGDLAEDGAVETYERLGKFLAKENYPAYLLAGNHDSIENIQRAQLPDNISLVESTDLAGWRFVFLNSQVAGESYGLLDHDQLSKLTAQLEQAGDAPVVIALHHSPVPVCPQANCQLHNAAELARLIESFPGVKAVIAGHTHIEAELDKPGHVQYTTPSTFAQVEHGPAPDTGDGDFWSSHTLDGRRHGFRVLDLWPDGRHSSQVHWVYDDESDRRAASG